MSDQKGIPIVGIPKQDKERRVEIARSFSYKLNAGNYESRDFFCSQKCECSVEESFDVSLALYSFCRDQVLSAVREYRKEMDSQRAKEAQRKSA